MSQAHPYKHQVNHQLFPKLHQQQVPEIQKHQILNKKNSKIKKRKKFVKEKIDMKWK